jgi:hypothetical protein
MKKGKTRRTRKSKKRTGDWRRDGRKEYAGKL